MVAPAILFFSLFQSISSSPQKNSPAPAQSQIAVAPLATALETCSFVSAPATRRQTTAGSSRRARDGEEEEAEKADAKSSSSMLLPLAFAAAAALALRRSIRRRRRCWGASGEAAETPARGRDGRRGAGEPAGRAFRRTSCCGAVFIFFFFFC